MKYIIDVPIDRVKDGLLQVLIEVENVVPRYMGTGISVKPYTEPDRKAIEDAQEEAWEFAKQVTIMTPDDKCELWGTSKYNAINLGYSYAEAKARYDEWRKQRDEVHVGDEVLYRHEKYFVGYVDDYRCHLIDINWMRMVVDKEKTTKTGRHFDEVEELLKKMREESE